MMRSIIALLIALIAVPCYAVSETRIVDPSHPNAQNVPIINGGGDADTPWISPSYGLVQLDGDNDSMVIRAPGTDSAYLDYLAFGAKWVNLYGVSVNGDSPTFEASGGIQYQNSTSGCTKVVDGFRFYNRTIGNYIIYAISQTTTSNIYVKDCVFDSFTMNNSLSPSVFILSTGPVGQTVNLFIENSAFANIPKANYGYAVGAYYDNVSFNIVLKNVTMSNLACAIQSRLANNNAATANFSVIDCILNTDTLVAAFQDGNWSRQATISVINTDTYGNTQTNHAPATRYAANLTINASNNYNIDPQFKYAIGNSLYAYGYLQDTAPSSVTSGSTTAGLIGVLWGWAEAVAPTPAAALQYLYRGMNLMQRFEIIRRR